MKGQRSSLLSRNETEGYYFRAADGLVYFAQVARWRKEPRLCRLPNDEQEAFTVIPRKHLPGVTEEMWNTLHAQIEHEICYGDIHKFFFPHYLPNHDYRGALNEGARFGYFVIGTELHKRFAATGNVDEDWLHALGYAALLRGCSRFMSPWSGHNPYLLLMYQIHDAETEEEYLRILNVVRTPKEGERITIPGTGPHPTVVAA